MKITKIKKQVGITSCGPKCSYFSGTGMEHDCGKPIYEDFYKCECGESFISKSACKIHQSIKHKQII